MMTLSHFFFPIKGTVDVVNSWVYLSFIIKLSKELGVPRLHWCVSKHSGSCILYPIVTSLSIKSLQGGFAFERERDAVSLYHCLFLLIEFSFDYCSQIRTVMRTDVAN